MPYRENHTRLRRAATGLEEAILHDPRGEIKPALQRLLSLLQEHASAAAELPDAQAVAVILRDTP